jgi:hypothetical protein
MLSKITQKVEQACNHKIVRKTFQRNLQTIKTASGYIDNKLYYRSWEISEYGRKQKLSQSYSNGQPIKNSKSILDFYA